MSQIITITTTTQTWLKGFPKERTTELVTKPKDGITGK